MQSLPVFLINLDRRKDRLEKMQKRLSGVNFIRISAVDGAELTLSDQEKDYLQHGLYPMSKNELACIKSHLSVCQSVVDGGLPFACVLEDDVVLSGDFKYFVVDDSWIHRGAGVIKIETMKRPVWISRKKMTVRGRSLLKLGSFHAGAAGYIISIASAKKMLELLKVPDRAADDLIFERAITSGELGEILQMSPALCVQEFVHFEKFSQSDLSAGREELRSAAKKKPKVMEKLIREIARPFQQLRIKTRYFNEVYGVVPFE